ncbi:MAG: hypothetical protein LBG83_02395 [Oscillospiraceae bacterium]|jgi:hypothetical protein|nr:hypothetical protein [Oscillospiraceae bacterium]
MKRKKRAKNILFALLAAVVVVIGAFALMMFGGRIISRRPVQYQKLLQSQRASYSQLLPLGVFPKDLDRVKQVETFYFEYYNPWDACYLIYLVADYTEDSYAAEAARLRALPLKPPPEPLPFGAEGFSLPVLALSADRSCGYCYALAEESNRRIVYVLIEFCNYFTDIKKYPNIIPSAHLPIGFNALPGNPEWQAFENMPLTDSLKTPT